MKIGIAFFLAALYTADLFAGIIPVPNLVFINLDEQNYANLNVVMRNVVNNIPGCWNGNEALFYMRKRPLGMTNDLAKKIINGDQKAWRKASKVLLGYKDQEVKGFDGLVVFSSRPKPMFYGISVGNSGVTSADLGGLSEKEVETAFCAVMPPVVREP